MSRLRPGRPAPVSVIGSIQSNYDPNKALSSLLDIYLILAANLKVTYTLNGTIILISTFTGDLSVSSPGGSPQALAGTITCVSTLTATLNSGGTVALSGTIICSSKLPEVPFTLLGATGTPKASFRFNRWGTLTKA